MKYTSGLLCAAAIGLAVTAAASAEVIYADRTVACQGDGANHVGVNLPIKNAGPLGMSPRYDRKIWIGLDLSSVSADFGAATVTLTQTDPLGGSDGSPADTWTFGLYGLTDEALDGWAVGDFNYSSAPGNLSGEGQGGTVDPSVTTLLGTFDITGEGSAGVANTVSTSALIDFLNGTRAGGNATLILVRHTPAGDNIVHGFAPSGTSAGPSLTYTLVPEPAPLLLLAAPAAVALRRRPR